MKKRICLLLTAYCLRLTVFASVFVPPAPDYNDTTMWISIDEDTEGTGADVFYVVSTWEEDHSRWSIVDGQRARLTSHYADVWNPIHREHMATEIRKVATYMSPGNRFYAPYYRHTTIEAFMTGNDDTVSQRARLAMDDVCTAFDNFLTHRDKPRPLIITGFSQGGLALVELLKHMSDETYRQLAAAYVLDYKVTPEDTLRTKHIKAAQGETDIGVTVCYNTVKDVRYIQPVVGATCMAINPVNWRTDATPATLRSSRFTTLSSPVTVTLSPEYHVLVVTGYSGSEYSPYKDFINVGDIHSCEPWLYSDCLQQNIRERAKAWRKSMLTS